MIAWGLVPVSFPLTKLSKPQKPLAKASCSGLCSLPSCELGIRPAPTLPRCKPGSESVPLMLKTHTVKPFQPCCLCRHVTRWVQEGFCAPLQRSEHFLRTWVLNFLLQRVLGAAAMRERHQAMVYIENTRLGTYPWRKNSLGDGERKHGLVDLCSTPFLFYYHIFFFCHADLLWKHSKAQGIVNLYSL